MIDEMEHHELLSDRRMDRKTEVWRFIAVEAPWRE